MDEDTRQILLAQVLKKKAFRDQRRLTRPSNPGIFRLALRQDQACNEYESAAELAPACFWRGAQ